MSELIKVGSNIVSVEPDQKESAETEACHCYICLGTVLAVEEEGE